ncbi:MAG TPA: gluconate 2-dehydrogenase subunit 3 family protein [Dehalococcoidia bacterium]|nr:gluconate 2-dehydrogenase subunit 3 family protein [Dehalococcoidia bacterium]
MKTLSKNNADILGEIVDLLIPAKENLPFPSKIDIVEHIDDALSNTPKIKRIFVEGLSDINNKKFLSLPKMEQIALLKKYESSNETFFSQLLRHTYNAYYTNPIVVAGIGMTGRPPQPMGYTLEKGNLTLLDKVIKKGQIWRNP